MEGKERRERAPNGKLCQGQADRHARRGGGRRICGRPHDAGGLRRDPRRSLARPYRGDPSRRPAPFRPHAGGNLHGPSEDAAPARALQRRRAAAHRRRLPYDEIVRHRLDRDARAALSRADRLRRLAAELHERGDDRRGRRDGARRSAASRRASPSSSTSPAASAGRRRKARPTTSCSASARCMAVSPSGCRTS